MAQIIPEVVSHGTLFFSLFYFITSLFYYIFTIFTPFFLPLMHCIFTQVFFSFTSKKAIKMFSTSCYLFFLFYHHYLFSCYFYHIVYLLSSSHALFYFLSFYFLYHLLVCI